MDEQEADVSQQGGAQQSSIEIRTDSKGLPQYTAKVYFDQNLPNGNQFAQNMLLEIADWFNTNQNRLSRK